MSFRILIVDDDEALCRALKGSLRSWDFAVDWETSADTALSRALDEDYDVVVTDIRMRGLGGLDFCHRLCTNRPNLPVVVITAFGSMQTAIEAIRAGAYDFLNKPFEVEQLALVLQRGAQLGALRTEVQRLREKAVITAPPRRFLGSSPAMMKLVELLDRVADTEATVLLTGETGTGKELAARALHDQSGRADGPFVAVNCAAMPAQLLESELFGHTRGAFTNATRANPGLLSKANGGTLFLDEIGELPLELQPKLLRAIQERAVRPVGATAEVPFDVRLVAATNRDLEAAVDSGQFRADLLYRVNVIQVHMPPLRKRGNDVLLLAQHHIEIIAHSTGRAVRGLSGAAADKLMAYSWPGNVRELQNCVERAVALARFEEIVPEDLPEAIRDYRTSPVLVTAGDGAELLPMHEVERRYILKVLTSVSGNKTEAARILGFDRKTLYRKLDRYDLGEPPAR